MQVEKEKMQMTDHHFPIRAFSYSSLRTDISATFHIHSEIELLFVSRGEMTFHINSEVIRVKKNQVMFITENTIHACYASSKNEETQTYLLQFDPLLIFGTNIFKDYNYLSRFIEKKDSHYYIMNAFTETNLDSFGFLMKEIVKEFKLKQTAYDITIKSYIYKKLLN